MDTVFFITDVNARSRVYQAAGAQEAVAAAGMRLEVIEHLRLTEPLADSLAFWRPVGAILEGSCNRTVASDAVRGLPLVHLDPPDWTLDDPTAFTVLNDAEGIADFAFRELADCPALAFVGWNPDVGWSHRRYARFAAHAAAQRKDCRALKDALTFGNKAEFATRIRPFLSALPAGCGVFAVNDAYAAAVLDACAELGRAVPGDLKVVGVDDDPAFCDSLHPTLTSVRPGFRTSGRLSADLLLKRLADPALPPQKLVYSPLGLTRRLSTRTLGPVPAGLPVDAALDYIRREACNGLTATDVVKFLGLSERAAEARFKKATGRTILDEIISVRMERVFELLKKPNQTIEPIANLCGWGSSIYLKRLFKARTGLTMSEWRERQRVSSPAPRSARWTPPKA